MVFSLRCIVADVIITFLDEEVKSKIVNDLSNNGSKADMGGFYTRLNLILINRIPYRNLFYYRIKEKEIFMIKILRKISEHILPGAKSVEILGGEIGGGLMIAHNNCVIHPKIIGQNCKIGPGVIIGKNKGERPTIGDNVYIAANAVVVGDVKIGNNSIIGAGSVVMKDIPENEVWVGNPAQFLKRID